MAFENFNSAIFVNYNSNGIELIPQRLENSEWITVQPTSVGMLSQIPYSKYRVLLQDIEGVNLIEVFGDEEIGFNNFKVAYDTSCLVWFHPSKIGLHFKVVLYYGIGVQYISSDRVFSGFNQAGRPIVIGDLNKVVEDYDNRIKPDYIGIQNDYKTIQSDYSAKKIDYQTNIVNNYQTTVKQDYTNTVKIDYKNTVKDAYKIDVSDPWSNTLKPTLEKAILDYQTSVNPTMVSTSYWTKSITVNNTTSFQIDQPSFNPLTDQVYGFNYQAVGQVGCVGLILNKDWSRVGATITLLNGLSFDSGDEVFITVFRGIKESLPPGTNGGDLQNGSVTQAKLSLDVQNKLNNLYTRKRFLYTATANSTQFTLDATYVTGDMLEIFQNNLMLFEGDEYSISGKIITLGEAMDIGDKVYYFINKNN